MNRVRMSRGLRKLVAATDPKKSTKNLENGRKLFYICHTYKNDVMFAIGVLKSATEKLSTDQLEHLFTPYVYEMKQ